MIEKLNYILSELNRRLFRNFVSTFGIIWLFIESLTLFFESVKSLVDEKGNIIFLTMVLLSIIMSLIFSRPKKNLFRKFRSSNTSISIKVGSLLTQKGNIAIGVSNYFDTVKNNPQSKSLKRQVIDEVFKGNVELVDEQIKSSLKRQNIKGKVDPNKTYGKKKKYKVGTIARLKINNQQIFFVVFSKLLFDNRNNKVTLTDIPNLNKMLLSLWQEVHSHGNNEEISIPVFGSGLSRLSISRLILIQTIIMSFVGFARNKRITKKLNIIINENSYDPSEFYEIENFLNSLEF